MIDKTESLLAEYRCSEPPSAATDVLFKGGVGRGSGSLGTGESKTRVGPQSQISSCTTKRIPLFMMLFRSTNRYIKPARLSRLINHSRFCHTKIKLAFKPFRKQGQRNGEGNGSFRGHRCYWLPSTNWTTLGRFSLPQICWWRMKLRCCQLLSVVTHFSSTSKPRRDRERTVSP